ncbi:Hypothetical protein FKW44_011411 [Caligus rogercresseyi]|uniref:Uncharacterized protein n=1 Tax=Caligus rogercresseyi TaxID=217165 RepID=A0A7T8K841_CALRO|nr:Hypothetical protein FKW44_011411 [Caligus rogercresseyi]
MSSSSGILTPPPQARKRVELVTLSLPDEDIEMAEEEETEEDEPLLLEDEEESPLKNP